MNYRKSLTAFLVSLVLLIGFCFHGTDAQRAWFLFPATIAGIVSFYSFLKVAKSKETFDIFLYVVGLLFFGYVALLVLVSLFWILFTGSEMTFS